MFKRIIRLTGGGFFFLSSYFVLLAVLAAKLNLWIKSPFQKKNQRLIWSSAPELP